MAAAWGEPMSRSARGFLVSESVVAVMWLVVFSDPRVSLLWSSAAAASTLVLLLVAAISAATARGRTPYRPSARRSGRMVAAALVVALAAIGLCTTRAPMWVRFDQARPGLLELASEAQRGGGGHRALAGTYYLHTFTADQQGVVFFDTTHSGFLEESGFAYYAGGNPNTAGRSPGTTALADGRTYTHLTGPWWIAVEQEPWF